MKKYLFIDDIREPDYFIGIDCYVARSYKEAIKLLRIEHFNYIKQF